MTESTPFNKEPLGHEYEIISVIETVVHPKYIGGVGGGMHKIPIDTPEQLMRMIEEENLLHNGFGIYNGIYRSTFLNDEKMITVRYRPKGEKNV